MAKGSRRATGVRCDRSRDAAPTLTPGGAEDLWSTVRVKGSNPGGEEICQCPLFLWTSNEGSNSGGPPGLPGQTKRAEHTIGGPKAGSGLPRPQKPKEKFAGLDHLPQRRERETEASLFRRRASAAKSLPVAFPGGAARSQFVHTHDAQWLAAVPRPYQLTICQPEQTPA
jgi:hypothetical protein